MKKRIVKFTMGCNVNLQWFYSDFTMRNFAKKCCPLRCRRVVNKFAIFTYLLLYMAAYIAAYMVIYGCIYGCTYGCTGVGR